MSLRARIVSVYLRATRKRAYESEARVAQTLAQPKTSHVPPARLRRALSVDRHTIEGRPCWMVRPKSGATAGAVVYLHGGSYVHEIVKEHWQLVARLVEEARCVAYVPIYGSRRTTAFARRMRSRSPSIAKRRPRMIPRASY